MESGKLLVMNIKNLVNPLLIIFLAAGLRLVPHPPNFAPIGAMALFGGVYLSKKHAFVVPLSTMLVSDLFLGFHNTIPFVYGSFLLIGLVGIVLKRKKSPSHVVTASLSSSIIFFVITNFGVWLVGGLYPPTVNGLSEAYIMALPFFRNTVLGDLFYTCLLFGGYELVTKIVRKPAREAVCL